MSKRPASNNQSSSNRSSNKQSGGDRSSRSRPVRKFGRPRRRVSNRPSDDPRPRLQKVLAAAGLGSRRESEQMILDGRVEVDRKVVTELGSRVDPTSQEVRVDGEVLKRPKLQHFMINKPMGVVSTASDPAGRLRVTDLVKSSQRLFTVGRLDMSSEGLILVTNDGELTNLLAHPRYGVEKVYLAQVVGTPTAEVLAKLERGIHLAEGYAHAKRVRIKGRYKQSTTLEIVLDEGRNREVRRLLARVGHKVLRLKRIALGRLRLGSLAPGEYRSLQKKEIDELKHGALEAIRLGTKQDPRPKRPKPVKEEVAIQPVESDAYPVDEIEIIAAAPSTSDQEYDWFINQPSPTVIGGADDEFDDDDGSNVEDADTETEVKRTAESDRQARRRARNAILPAGRASSEATDGDSTADKKPPRKTASPTGDATSPPRGGPVIRPILDVRKSSIVPPWMRKDADLEDDESPDDENDDDDIVASSEAQQRPPRAAGKPGFRPKRRPHASLKSPQSSRSSKDRAARTDKPRQSKGEHAAHEQADTQRGQRPDKRGAGNYRGESSRSESAGEGRSHGSARGKQKSARPGPPRDGASAGASSRPARFKAGSAKAGASRGGPPKGNTARGGTPKGGAAKGGAGKTARPTPGGRGRIQSSTTKKSGSKPATARGNNRKSKGKGR